MTAVAERPEYRYCQLCDCLLDDAEPILCDNCKQQGVCAACYHFWRATRNPRAVQLP